eukprot:Sspe_Gene.1164::Locus_398_Transcript_2_2_Confidence_0.667_Length_1961::g.1164::m.1164
MVESQKERYQYSETSNIPDIAMLKELPKEELPTEEWKQAVEKMVKGTVLNHLTDVWDRVKDDNFRVLHQLFKFLTDRDNYNDRPSGIESYDDLMNNLSYESGRELDEDAAFCRYRLAGPNPTMVRPATAELLAKMKFEEYAGNDDQLKETVSTALVEKRLYCVDYDFLRNLPAGQNGGHQKFVVNPIALFALPKDETAAQRMGLDVLCIQCIPGLPSTIFTREDGNVGVEAGEGAGEQRGRGLPRGGGAPGADAPGGGGVHGGDQAEPPRRCTPWRCCWPRTSRGRRSSTTRRTSS